MKFFLFILATLNIYSKVLTSNYEEALAQTNQGTLRGKIEKSFKGRNIYSFLGVPYSEKPQRFKPLEPLLPWSGIRDALNYADYCLQIPTKAALTDPDNASTTGSEDCVYLNIYSPNLNYGAKLPVMFYIHGGYFERGGSREYRPPVLLDEDVVLVVIGYRLNIFGCFTTGDDIAPGNIGVLDIITGLKWVKENIHHFGGDKNRVTAFGHSSGGMTSQLLAISPMAKGLIHRAIIQSGTMSSMGLEKRTADIAEDYSRIGEKVGCFSKELGSEKFLQCMTNVDSLHLFEAYHNHTKDETNKPVLRIDGTILPDYPSELIKKGLVNKVSIMAGLARDDLGFFLLDSISKSPESMSYFLRNPKVTLQHALSEMYSSIRPSNIFQMHSGYFINTASDKDIWKQYIQMGNDLFLGVSLYILSHFTNKHFGEDNVYIYNIDHRGQHSYVNFFPTKTVDSENWSIHGDDLFYLFSGGPLFDAVFEREEDLKVRQILVKLWTNFAATGNPTPDASLGFTWKSTSVNDFPALSISVEPKMKEKAHEKLGYILHNIPSIKEYFEGENIIFPPITDFRRKEEL